MTIYKLFLFAAMPFLLGFVQERQSAQQVTYIGSAMVEMRIEAPGGQIYVELPERFCSPPFVLASPAQNLYPLNETSYTWGVAALDQWGFYIRIMRDAAYPYETIRFNWLAIGEPWREECGVIGFPRPDSPQKIELFLPMVRR